MSTTLRIGIITGSTRPTRIGHQVSEWLQKNATELGTAEYTLIDLAEIGLPLLDEPLPAGSGQYSLPHTQRWAEIIAPLDGFIFVTPEYNHAPPASLINALSFLAAEWANKAAAIVSYGYSAAGARAAQMLRPILGQLNVADISQQLLFSVPAEFEGYATFAPAEKHLASLSSLLEQLESWAGALQQVRARSVEAAQAA